MKKLITLGLAILMVLSGCFSTPAREVTNICDLLDEKVSWYRAVKKSEEKWGAPMHIQLAIIYQELKSFQDTENGSKLERSGVDYIENAAYCLQKVRE